MVWKEGARLKNASEHLLNIINAVADGIFVKDRKHHFVLMNEANINFIGRKWEELEGKSDHDFFPKAEADVFWEKDEEVFRSSRENLNEETLTNAEGRRNIILTRKALYQDRSGNKYIVGVSHDITERKHLEQKLKQALQKVKSLSLTDELTKLYNRRGFMTLAHHETKMANRKKSGFIILFLDMDGMKKINDTFGHEAGDQALRDTARILKATFRESDIIARIGGDEFVILAIDSPKAGGKAITRKLVKSLSDYNANNKGGFTLSFSTGICHYSHKRPSGVEAVLKKADALMYKEKKLKRGNSASFAGKRHRPLF